MTPALPMTSAGLARGGCDGARARTRVVSGRAGLTLRRGEAEVRVVGPRHATRASSPNDAALVVLARQGAARSCCPPMPKRPCCCAASSRRRESSRSPTTAPGPLLGRLLARLRPRLAIISVGAGNTYGHPSPATLATLAQAGVPVRRTDLEGDIALGRGPAG